MSDEPTNYWGVVGAIASAAVGWVTHWLKERSDRTRAVQAELKTFGSDIIEELRVDLAESRKSRATAHADAERYRDLAWRWQREHDELAVEHEALRRQAEHMSYQLREALDRSARLSADVDRYQRELADTKDIAPKISPDDTGPISKPKRRT